MANPIPASFLFVMVYDVLILFVHSVPAKLRVTRLKEVFAAVLIKECLMFLNVDGETQAPSVGLSGGSEHRRAST